MTAINDTPEDVAWYALPAQDAARRLSAVPAQGLGADEAEASGWPCPPYR